MGLFGTCVSGYVVKVGESVTRFKPGDYVASFIHGGDFTSPAKGAYSKLAITQEIYSIKLDHLEQSTIDHIPYGKVTTYEGASELVGTLVTIGISLYKTLGGSFENPQNKSFLIYGGSTSTGLVAAKFAKLFGWRVISVASRKNQDLVKHFGADYFVDYHDQDFVEQIKTIDSDITIALHAVGGESTLGFVVDSMSTRLPSRIDSLVCSDFSAFEKINPQISYSMTRAFTANGRDVVYANGQAYSPLRGMKETTREFLLRAEKLINDGTLEHVPLCVCPGGLEGINYALQVIRNREVSAEKLVIRI